MAKNLNLQIVIEAIDKFSDVIKKNEEHFKKFGLAAASIGASITGALGLAVKAASDQEKANLLLASSMKTAGIYTDDLYSKLVNYASELQKTTKYSDDAIMSAQRLLIQFGATGENINQLTQATLDFASALGMDLNSAALLIGKTLSGEVNTLSRYGISLEGVKDQSEKVKIITEKIADLFGGTAKTEADTFAGSIEKLKNKISDTAEKIGFSLLPFIDNFITAAGTIVDKISKWIEENKKLMDILIPLGTSLGIVLTAVGGISLALPKLVSLWESFNALVGATKTLLANHPLFLIPTTLAAIYAGAEMIVGMYNKQKEQEASLNKTIEGRIKWYEQEIDKLKSKKKLTEEEQERITKYQKAIENLKKTIEEREKTEKKVAENVKDTQKQLEEFKVRSFQSIYREFEATMFAQKTLYGITLSETSQILWQTLSFKEKLWITFKNSVSTLWSDLIYQVQQGYQNWQNSLTSFGDVVTSALRSTQSYLSDVIFVGIKNGWDAMMDAMKNKSDIVINSILKAFTDYLAGGIMNFFLSTFLPFIFNAIVAIFTKVKKKGIANVIIDMYEAIASATKWLVAQLGPAGLLAAVGAAALIIAYFEDIKRKIEEVRLAEGGIVTRPVHALIGEAGPEAVIPLSRFPSLFTGGLTININIQGTLIEGNELKWEDITKRYIIKPIQKWLSKSGAKLR